MIEELSVTLSEDEITEILAPFEWTPAKQQAAVLLAQGMTRSATASEIGYGEAQIYRWLNHPEFSAEVDRLTFITGIATKAARIRMCKRLISQRIDEESGMVVSKKDVLDWLRFLKDELGPLEFAAIMATIAGADADRS